MRIDMDISAFDSEQCFTTDGLLEMIEQLQALGKTRRYNENLFLEINKDFFNGDNKWIQLYQ